MIFHPEVVKVSLNHWKGWVKTIFSWSACKGQWRTALWKKWIICIFPASVYYSCPLGLTPATAQWLLEEENFRGSNWGPEKLYWKTLASHEYPLQWNLFKIMLFIPNIQLFSQYFLLSFTKHLYPPLFCYHYYYFSLSSRPSLHFPWDNFNNLVFLLTPLSSRTMVTSDKILSWESSQSSRKPNMDVGNFNKNILRYNHRNTYKKLGNISKGNN